MSAARHVPAALWPEVSALFDDAVALPVAERPAWLADVARTRPAAAAALGDLLAAHDTQHDLPTPSGELLSAALGAGVQTLAPGDGLDIYRLAEPLGAGGMAAVWSADQLQGVQRRVALKLPHAGIEAPAAMARRFETERDLLASLEHPHIARLYGAGTTPAGQPFLAMELISGQPITQHAAALPLRRRLVLFLQVLSAVSFAHGRLVIHRDLKPGNILVTAAGQVKLLDFGIARLLGDADGAPGTATGGAFTPDCASPEQLAGTPLGVASDVYSLGVVLYELLAGLRPYTLDRHSSTPLAVQLAAAVVQSPSAAARAAGRDGFTGDFTAGIAGDLDAIAACAMALDPAARYPNVEALAADLRAHLDGLPVQARGAGRRYRAGVFLRRHRLPLFAGAVVLAALTTGLGMALWQANAARGQAQRAQAVQRFLVQVFNASRPEQARGREVSAKSLLDQGARRLEVELRDQPAVRAELHREIGTIYTTLGDNAQARRQLDQALALYAQLGTLDSEAALDAAFLQFEVMNEEMQFDAARQAAAQLLQRAERSFGPGHRWALPVARQLAWVSREQGDYAGAEALVRRTLAQATPQSDAVELLRLRSVLANTLYDQGRFGPARDEFAAVVAASAGIAGYETTDSLADRYNLARAHYGLAEYAVAAQTLTTLVAAMDTHLGPRHDRTLKARSLWAQCEAELGRYAQAVAVQRDNLAHALAREAVDDDVASLQRLTLAKLLRSAGRHAEGVPLAQQGQAFFDAKYSQPTWLRERGRWVLAELLVGAGRVDEGLAALDQARRHMTTLPGHAQHTAFADVLQSQALALHLRGRGRGRATDAAQARNLMAQAEAIQSTALGATSLPARRTRLHRLWLDALAQPVDAAAVAAFETAASEWAGAGPMALGETALMRAEWLARAGRDQPAQQERARGAALWQQALGLPWSGRFTGLH
jgi:eukaryotic-like serine/threonine-protein kinase